MTEVLLHAPGRMARRDLLGGQAVLACVTTLAVVTALDLTDGRLGAPFAVGFVLICATAPLAVRADALLVVVILPPLLLTATIVVLCAWWPQSVALAGVPAGTGVLGRALAKVVDLGVLLLIAHGLTLLTAVARILTAPKDGQPRISST